MKLVLVVDDSATVRSVINMTLTEMRYKVMEASDGVMALRLAKEHKFDLIITDLNMPNMDGCTLCQELRKTPGYRFTPILMLTTVGKEQAKTCGASAWLQKPFKPEQLSAILRIVCPPKEI
jgi:two-component system chemotaxis response regulator CheY